VTIAVNLDQEATWLRHPFVRSWNGHNPLPLRTMVAPSGRRNHSATGKAPPWVLTGPTERPFDFCEHIRWLCEDIAARSDTLRHVDVSRLLFTVTQARSYRLHGLQARVTPLRFRGGALLRKRWGTTYRVQRYFVGGREMLYVVAFCLPRFLDQDFDDKLVTLFHELYHISPAFDGDLRRHHGRYCIHSHSKRNYDKHMADLARDYLAKGGQATRNGFLRLNFAQLQERHGAVVGVVVPRPKLIPLPAPKLRQVMAASAKRGRST
jgi:predicted metallopeptidase